MVACQAVTPTISSHVLACCEQMMAGDPEESTVNCVDAWVAKLLDGKTLTESEVIQLCSKVCTQNLQHEVHPFVALVVVVIFRCVVLVSCF